MFKIEQQGNTVFLTDTEDDNYVVFGRVTEDGRTVWEDDEEFYLRENDLVEPDQTATFVIGIVIKELDEHLGLRKKAHQGFMNSQH